MPAPYHPHQEPSLIQVQMGHSRIPVTYTENSPSFNVQSALFCQVSAVEGRGHLAKQSVLLSPGTSRRVGCSSVCVFRRWGFSQGLTSAALRTPHSASAKSRGEQEIESAVWGSGGLGRKIRRTVVLKLVCWSPQGRDTQSPQRPLPVEHCKDHPKKVTARAGNIKLMFAENNTSFLVKFSARVFINVK